MLVSLYVYLFVSNKFQNSLADWVKILCVWPRMNPLKVYGCSELKTLEWINFNPDFLIRISTVETFHFSP